METNSTASLDEAEISFVHSYVAHLNKSARRFPAKRIELLVSALVLIGFGIDGLVSLRDLPAPRPGQPFWRPLMPNRLRKGCP